jgi:hypothetical protein
MTDTNLPTPAAPETPSTSTPAQPLNEAPKDRPDATGEPQTGIAENPLPTAKDEPQLTKAQKALIESRDRRHKEQVKKEREAIEAEKKQLATLKEQWEQEQIKRKEEYQKNPHKLVEDFGYKDFSDYTYAVLNLQKPTISPEEELKSTVESLKKEQERLIREREEERQKALQYQQEQTRRQALDVSARVIKERIESPEGDSFPLVRETNAYNLISEVVTNHYLTHGEVLDPILLAGEVEKDLQAREEELDRFFSERQLRLAARKGGNQTLKESNAQQTKPIVGTENKQPKTISNSLSVSSGVSDTEYDQLTPEKKVLRDMAKIIKIKPRI